MDIYGLIGYPLKHSFSSKFFFEKFDRENIFAKYLNFEIPQIDLLPNIIEVNPNLKGLNVTIPYKEVVMTYLDEIDEEAQAIGAVNVIKIKQQDGKNILKGYNSDLYGFQNSMRPLLNGHAKALVLGTGGASKAVVRGLSNLGLETKYVSRSAREDGFTYADLDEATLAEYTVIVNASPVGTFPNVDECPNIPYEYLTENHVLYDLVYNPVETLFLQKGKEKGAVVKNGAEMLELQALAAWEIWNKIE